ncbi:MAG TPA: gamma carbonic anhydrase family protein, partial [Ktedonobacteraceae bacterium]|nr:gamma carbonic anhydrase family protein [Ktedonobacteraceae bacterium]
DHSSPFIAFCQEKFMPVLPFQGIWPTIEEDVFIAPGAIIIGNVTLRSGVSVWYNAVLRGDVGPIVIGHRTNIQDNCTLHLDDDAPLTIGDDCTIGHGAIVHGATLGDRVLVGMKAVVLSHAQIGSDCILGACALLAEYKKLASGFLAVGVPAKTMRELTPAEHSHLITSAQGYYERAQVHQNSLAALHNNKGN